MKAAVILYDYSFRPEVVAPERAVDWAAEANRVCAQRNTR